MALTCGFFNSVDGDRKYDATQFASLFDGVITDGVVAAVGDFFATTPGGGMVVNVGSGRAWFNRTWTYSDAKIPLTLDASDLLYDRIDAVVLEIDTSFAVRDNSIKVVKGTPAQEPQKPALTNAGDVYQYALAYVRVKASAMEIGAGDITINVGQADCPFVTSIIETPELEVLFAQWDAQFTEWFENVQSQLEGDIAANLQRQIDERVKILDVAIEEDVLEGVSDTKWVSPKSLKPYLGAVKDNSTGNIVNVHSRILDYYKNATYLKGPWSGYSSTVILCNNEVYHSAAVLSGSTVTVTIYKYSLANNKNDRIRLDSLAVYASWFAKPSVRGVGAIPSNGNNVLLFRFTDNLNVYYDVENNIISSIYNATSESECMTKNYRIKYNLTTSSDSSFSKSTRVSKTNNPSYSTFTADLRSGRNHSLIGIYDDYLFISVIESDESYHIHKVNFINNSVQKDVAIFSPLNHTSNISLSGLSCQFQVVSYDDEYVYILPAYKDSSNLKIVIGTKTIKFSMKTFSMNWNEITSFFEIATNKIGALMTYIGNQNGNMFVFLQPATRSIKEFNPILIEIDSNDLSVSTSSLIYDPSVQKYMTSDFTLYYNLFSGMAATYKYNNDIYKNILVLTPQYFLDLNTSSIYAFDLKNINNVATLPRTGINAGSYKSLYYSSDGILIDGVDSVRVIGGKLIREIVYESMEE